MLNINELRQNALDYVNKQIDLINTTKYISTTYKMTDKLRLSGFVNGLESLQIINFYEWERMEKIIEQL